MRLSVPRLPHLLGVPSSSPIPLMCLISIHVEPAADTDRDSITIEASCSTSSPRYDA